MTNDATNPPGKNLEPVTETVPEQTPETGPNWTIMDIAAIAILGSGGVFALLPWGVFQSRLSTLDLSLMFIPAFILVAALISFTATSLRRKTNGTRNSAVAGIGRALIWLSIIGLLGPIFVRFITALLQG